ncbi:hypothetical protein [Psychrobacillus vulpis]|uniref:Uncharacterized protein n=1 Tax=Psychrobacillus vulpis TaxID=2325572 RepID=A0A544TSE5_9BACI|nr:hypothetical protein [Psychrobacillus vulpis]TQR20371.1 hypothetical protein FG384_07985 [Psychrobacillus vulpis]
MENNKISMMDAFLIETLRSNGISNDEILTKLEQKDLRTWENEYPNNRFSVLITLFEEDQTKFKSILMDGYSVKFITMNGLKNLLKLKFEKIDDRDYQLHENGIECLEIDEQQLSSLKQLLSINWIIQEQPLENNKSTSKLVNIVAAVTN